MKGITKAILLALLCLGTLHVQAEEPFHPNVIVVLADDLGIGDLSATNGECKIKTPSLQKMAEEGITFLDAHSSSSVCTPTRYGLLTGRYNWRSRLERGVLSGTSDHLIPAERATLAHLLHKAGYHTQMIGKWHLGWDWARADEVNGKGKGIDFTQPIKNGPNINGFDGYYGHCGSLDMPPYVWVDTGNITAVPEREEGVTAEQDRYGWYRKGPIGADFQIDDVLPHLFRKSPSCQLASGRGETGRAFLSLPRVTRSSHPDRPHAALQGRKRNESVRRLCDAGRFTWGTLGCVKKARDRRQHTDHFYQRQWLFSRSQLPRSEEDGHDPSADSADTRPTSTKVVTAFLSSFAGRPGSKLVKPRTHWHVSRIFMRPCETSQGKNPETTAGKTRSV